MTQDNFSKFGLDEGDEMQASAEAGSYDQEAQDEFELGGTGIVRLAYANGYQRNLVDEDGTVTALTAVGWTIDATKAPDNLIDAMTVLIGKGMARTENIQYSSGKVVESYIFGRNIGTDKRGMPLLDRSVRMVPLIHSVPNKSSIAKDIANQKGMVFGTYTDYDPEKNQHTTGGYCGFLAILPDLYEAGYRGNSGEALAVLIRLKGSSSKELYNAVMEHGVFVKALRDFKIKELVKGKVAPDKARQQVTRRVNMFTYSMSLSTTDGTKRHGSEKEHQDVYEVVNKAHLYDQLSEAYEKLYVGKALHGAILPLVYAEPEPGQPLVAGGEAIEWCRAHMAYQVKQQKIWNPNNDLLYKSRQPAPVWMTNTYMKLKSGTYDENTNNSERVSAPPVQGLDQSEGMLQTVMALKTTFAQTDNIEGLAMAETFIELYNDDATDAAEIDDLFGKITALVPRKRRALK